MPEIDAKVREGVGLEAIVKALAEDGITIKAKTLKEYLYRWRKGAAQAPVISPALPGKPAPAPQSEAVRPAQAERIEAKGDETSATETGDDPETETPTIDDLLKGAGSDDGDFTDQFMPKKTRLLKTKRTT